MYIYIYFYVLFSSFRYQTQKEKKSGNCFLSFFFTYLKRKGFLTVISLLIASLFEKNK